MSSLVRFSKHNYVEYRAGSLNIIISVPHGGSTKPPSIKPRDSGGFLDGVCVYSHKASIQKDPDKYPVRQKKDLNTLELATAMAEHLKKIAGKWPHVVINNLHRDRMDPNADIERACFHNAIAEDAFIAYHSFIEQAQRTIATRALLLDIHGQAHDEDWLELGYTVVADDLNMRSYSPEMTSVYSCFRHSPQTMDDIYELLVGPLSLGSLLSDHGLAVVPSALHPGPGDGQYYSGGLITEAHGSKNGGRCDAIQIEAPATLRSTQRVHEFAQTLATCVYRFFQLHYCDAK